MATITNTDEIQIKKSLSMSALSSDTVTSHREPKKIHTIVLSDSEESLRIKKSPSSYEENKI